jgi:hypothetical protein
LFKNIIFTNLALNQLDLTERDNAKFSDLFLFSTTTDPESLTMEVLLR